MLLFVPGIAYILIFYYFLITDRIKEVKQKRRRLRKKYRSYNEQ